MFWKGYVKVRSASYTSVWVVEVSTMLRWHTKAGQNLLWYQRPRIFQKQQNHLGESLQISWWIKKKIKVHTFNWSWFIVFLPSELRSTELMTYRNSRIVCWWKWLCSPPWAGRSCMDGSGKMEVPFCVKLENPFLVWKAKISLMKDVFGKSS